MLPAENEHVAAQQVLALEATRLARGYWAAMGDQFDSSWIRVRPRVEAVTRSVMVGSAHNGSVVVQRQLEQAGFRVQPLAQVVPDAFGTQTMLGVDVADALNSVVIRSKQAVASGATTEQALKVGEEWLDELIRSVMADVDRAAQQALITATPRMGWVRIVPAPCCKRCAVLAGRWYPHSSGFARHPRCDCFHRPAPRDMSGTEDVATPQQLVDDGLVKGLTEDERRALEDGADFQEVVNQARGGRMTQVRVARGRVMSRRRGAEVRPTPAGIYELASDRDQAVRLLKQFGYLK